MSSSDFGHSWGSVWQRVAILFAFYFCQGLPGGFLANVVPVILREHGLDLKTIGFASALSLPWVAKILWAPWVDRFGSARFGRRRSWLVPTQVGMIAVTLALARVDPTDVVTIAALFLVLNMFAATQDVAVDALAVDLLPKRDLGPGNAAQVSGFKVGNLVGGGVLLGLLPLIGWRGDFLVMALLLTLALMISLGLREPPLEATQQPRSMREVFSSLVAAVRSGGWGFGLFLVFAKFAESFGGAQTKPMLTDHGVPKELIGVLDGIIGAIMTISGAVLAGWLVRRIGWARTLAGATVVQGGMLALLGVIQGRAFDVSTFAAINGIESFAGGGVAVAVFALAMQRCDRSTGATQFTAAQVLYMSGSFLAAPSGGHVADLWGYEASYAASAVFAVLLAPIALFAAPRFGLAATKS